MAPLLIAALVLVTAAGGAALAWYARGELVASLRSEISFRTVALDVRDARIAELERQVASLHAQGLRVEKRQPVVELPAEEALPSDVEDVLAGFESPDDAEEFRQYARTLRKNRPNLLGAELASAILDAE